MTCPYSSGCACTPGNASSADRAAAAPDRGPSPAAGCVAWLLHVPRTHHQFIAPAATAATTPTSTDATAAPRQPDGPTAASLPSPSGLPANAAPTPSTQPVSAPEQKPLIGADSSTLVGATRTTSSPPTIPAT